MVSPRLTPWGNRRQADEQRIAVFESSDLGCRESSFGHPRRARWDGRPLLNMGRSHHRKLVRGDREPISS